MIVGTLFIERLLKSSLKPKQKFLLSELAEFSGTASKFVASLTLPKSTIWHNLRTLQKLGLIVFGNSLPIKVHPLVAQRLERSAVTRQVACSSQAQRTSVEVKNG